MFSSKQSYSGLVNLDYRKNVKISATDTLDSICTSETGVISYGQTDKWIDTD